MCASPSVGAYAPAHSGIPSYVQNEISARKARVQVEADKRLAPISAVDEAVNDEVSLVIDVSGIILEIINPFANEAPPISPERVSLITTEIMLRLARLKEDCEENRRSILKARDRLFQEGREIKITRENFDQLLASYMVIIAERIRKLAENYPISTTTNLNSVKERLEAKIAEQRGVADMLVANKERLTNLYLKELETEEAKHLAEVTRLLANQAIAPVSFWNACALGNVDYLRKQIDEMRWYQSKSSLINGKNNEGFAPIHIAAQNGQLAVVEFLIGHKVDLNSRITIDVKVDKKYIKKEEGNTPLYLAAQGGHIAVVERLLDAGAPINAVSEQNRTPLHTAVFRDNGALVEILMKRGANPNVKEALTLITPLHTAVFKGFVTIYTSLLNYSQVDFKAEDDRHHTALHDAVEIGEINAIYLIMSNWSQSSNERDRKELAALLPRLLEIEPKKNAEDVRRTLRNFGLIA